MKQSELVLMLEEEGWDATLEYLHEYLLTVAGKNWRDGEGKTVRTETEEVEVLVRKDPKTGKKLAKPETVKARVVVSHEVRERTVGEKKVAGYRRRSEIGKKAQKFLRDIAYEWAVGKAEDVVIDGGDFDDFLDIVTGNESLPGGSVWAVENGQVVERPGEARMTCRIIWSAVTGNEAPKLPEVEVPLADYVPELDLIRQDTENRIRVLVDQTLEVEGTYGDLIKAVFAEVDAGDEEMARRSVHFWLKERGVRNIPDNYHAGWESRGRWSKSAKPIDPTRILHTRVTSQDRMKMADGSHEYVFNVGGVLFDYGQDDGDDGEETGILDDRFEEIWKADVEMEGWKYGDEYSGRLARKYGDDHHLRRYRMVDGEIVEDLTRPTQPKQILNEGHGIERPESTKGEVKRNGFGDALLGKVAAKVAPALVKTVDETPMTEATVVTPAAKADEPKRGRGRPKKDVVSNGFGLGLLAKK